MTSTRGSIRHAVRLGSSADDVWALVGDPARLAEWFPGIESCTVEGDTRAVVTRSGLPMPEHLLTVDPTLRRLQYRITAPMFSEHLGTIDVHDLGDGSSLVVYSTDAEPGGAGPGDRRRRPGRTGPPGRPTLHRLPSRRPTTR